MAECVHLDEAKLSCIKAAVKSIPDYPAPGILFRDVSSLCQDGKAFKLTIDLLYDIFKHERIDKVVSAEARGFVFGAPLAYALGCGLVLVRKPGKLPRRVIEEKYDLEYGKNTLQLHADAIKSGDRVLILDDLLATGGTMGAMIKLVQREGGQILKAAFVIELADLGGADQLKKLYNVDTFSLLHFPGH